MSLVRIPQIPGVAIGVDGTELMELVQGGVSKQVTTAVIAALASAAPGVLAEFILIAASPGYPNSRGLSVEASVLELTDEGAQLNLVISVAANGITNAKLAQMADQTLKGNISGALASPADLSIAQVIGASVLPINVTAAGAYNVPATSLSIVINKTDGANVVLPALANKVGSVRIVGAQATAHPFNVTLTDGTFEGGAFDPYPFTGNYQVATFFPFVAGNTWTVS